MRAKIYVEGGGPPDDGPESDLSSGGERVEIRDKSLSIECREEFTRLLQRCGLSKGRFQAIPSGGGGDAWNDFQDAYKTAAGQYYVAMLIDSEEAVENIEETWNHLARYWNWEKPLSADDDQVLFMTRCMETWIVADHDILEKHFGNELNVEELPPLDNLEGLSPGGLKNRLKFATRFCCEPYDEGRNSFKVLGKLNPDVLEGLLPSFRRVRRILRDKVG